MQTDPTLLDPTMLWLVASVCMEPQQCWHLFTLVVYSLKPVKLLGPCKRTQHCWPTTPNNVGSCWHLLRPFAWAFRPRPHYTVFKWKRYCFAPFSKRFLSTLIVFVSFSPVHTTTRIRSENALKCSALIISLPILSPLHVLSSRQIKVVPLR